MSKVARWIVGIVAALHVAFMGMEMFFWKSFATQVAPLKPAIAEAPWELGFNQGLYNGFLAAGLVWSLLASPPFNKQIAIFFLVCVLIAGIVGGLTIAYSILASQSLLAAVGLIVLRAKRTS